MAKIYITHPPETKSFSTSQDMGVTHIKNSTGKKIGFRMLVDQGVSDITAGEYVSDLRRRGLL